MKKHLLLGSAAALLITAMPVRAAPTASIRTGSTSVTPDAGFLAAADSLGVSVAPLSGRNLAFRITGGDIDLENAAGEILHSGGLSLSAGETVVELKSFAIDTSVAEPVLTGVAIVNEQLVGRIPLFKLSLPELSLPLQPAQRRFFGFSFSRLTIPGVGLSLTSEAAGALNASFGVTAFAEDFVIGEASVRAFGLRP